MGWTFYNSSGQRLSSAATNISVLDIDGATDIGAAIADADLFIIDDGAGGTNRKTAASRIATYIGNPVFGRVVRTAGNITTTSTSLVDATGATITFTTGAFPVGYSAAMSGTNDTTNSQLRINAMIDSTLLHGTSGLTVSAQPGGQQTNLSFSGQTAALSAAEHTIKMQWAVTGDTGTILAASDINFMWSAFEIR
jgi:hypothetical protein